MTMTQTSGVVLHPGTVTKEDRMKYQLVGVAGRPGSGVYAVAEYLKSNGYMRYGLSYPVKRGVAAMFSFGAAQIDGPERANKIPGLEVSPSTIIRDIGDFVRAHFGEDILLRLAAPVINGARLINKPLVITDVRTENDAVFVRSSGGVILHLYRPDTPADGRTWSGSGVAVVEGDVTILNNGTLFELHQDVARVLQLHQKASRKAA